MNASVLFTLAAVVLFALAAFGVTFGSFGELDLVAGGGALFAAGHLPLGF